MSGETERDVSGWTTDTLRTHLERVGDERDRRYEQRFKAQEEATLTALRAAKEAVSKAERAVEKRFDSVNEFRQTLTDQAGHFITRAESDSEFKRQDERLTDITDRLNRAEGERTGVRLSAGTLGAAVAALAAIVVVVNVIAAMAR